MIFYHKFYSQLYKNIPKISIFIQFYNKEKYIKRTIDSI